MRPNVGSLTQGSGRSGASSPGALRSHPLLGAPPQRTARPRTPGRRRAARAGTDRRPEARTTPPPPPACPPVPPAVAMSSSSSSPRETYEEDREYESQAKRLKTEEGEIDYSAEEGENRREATPRGGGDGGGRSFSQPVTKRGAPSARRARRLPGKQGPVAGTGSGPPSPLR